jgi:hypothetical protein
MASSNAQVARLVGSLMCVCVFLEAEVLRADDIPVSGSPRSTQAPPPPTAATSARRGHDDERPPPLAAESAALGDHYTLDERPMRPGLEILLGGVTAAAGGLVFGLGGGALCGATGFARSEEDGCLAPGLVLGYAGAMAAIPLGVYMGGELLGGDGSLATTLGVGWLLGAVSVVVTIAANSPVAVFGMAGATAVGSLVAYEATSERDIAAARGHERSAVQCMPFADGKRAGLLVFGAL